MIIQNLEEAGNILDNMAANIEANLKTVTDRLDNLDPLIQGKKQMYFICLHSGLFFPADYVKMWGRKYGIGLGGDPRSECLDSDYSVKPSLEGLKTIDDIMHPCKVSGAPLDVLFTSQPVENEHLLITSNQDRNGEKRAKVLRAKQLKNPENRINVLIARAYSEGLVWEANQ